MTAPTPERPPLDVAEVARWNAILQAGPNTGSDQQAQDYFTARYRLLDALPAILAALERIPELEQELTGLRKVVRDQNAERERIVAEAMANHAAAVQRAERVEAAARPFVVCEVAGPLESRPRCGACDGCRLGAAPRALRRPTCAAPAEEGLTQPWVNGRPFRCPCGANVFRKAGNKYTCNACGAEYEGTPAEEGDGAR